MFYYFHENGKTAFACVLQPSEVVNTMCGYKTLGKEVCSLITSISMSDVVLVRSAFVNEKGSQSSL